MDVARFRAAPRAWPLVLAAAALVGAGLSRPARADEVRLENGDLIRGEVLGGDEKTLRVKHVYGTEITVPWDKVITMATDKPVELRLVDGTRLKGKLKASPEPRTLDIETESAGPVQGVAIDRVVSLNEPPEDVLWTGRIALGVTILDGNSRSKTIFGGFDGERKTKNDRIEAHAYYAYGDNEGILATKKGFARMQYSYYVWAPAYLYAGGALEYDKLKDLKLRSRGGGGVGYAFFDTKALALRVEAGAEYVNEQYYDPTQDLQYIALRFAGVLEWQVTSFLRLTENDEFLPSLKQFRNFINRSTSSATFSLWKGFGLAGIIIWEHDEIPADSKLRDDTTYVLTLTYTF
jgi:hypothetical protein